MRSSLFCKTFFSVLLILPALLSHGQHTRPAASFARADSLFFASDYNAAREMYRKVLGDTSKNGTAWSRYGFCNLALKNYDEALSFLGKAMTFSLPRPVRMNTFASLSRVFSVKGNSPKALVHLDSAVALGYANLSVLDTSEDFKAIREDEKFKRLRQVVLGRAFPCMADPHMREFDFWVGEWDVYRTGTKTLVGKNTIEVVSGGCALLENWSSSASSGKSLNFIDPLTGLWRQTWVGSGNTQDFTDGEYKEGAMRFVYKTNRQGKSVMGRFIFYNEKPGQVRQFNEASLDGGKTWSTVYDFTYVKK